MVAESGRREITKLFDKFVQYLSNRTFYNEIERNGNFKEAVRNAKEGRAKICS